MYKSQRLIIVAYFSRRQILAISISIFAIGTYIILRYNLSKGVKIDERRRNNLDKLNRAGNQENFTNLNKGCLSGFKPAFAKVNSD